MAVGSQYKLITFIQDDWQLLHVGLCNILTSSFIELAMKGRR